MGATMSEEQCFEEYVPWDRQHSCKNVQQRLDYSVKKLDLKVIKDIIILNKKLQGATFAL